MSKTVGAGLVGFGAGLGVFSGAIAAGSIVGGDVPLALISTGVSLSGFVPATFGSRMIAESTERTSTFETLAASAAGAVAGAGVGFLIDWAAVAITSGGKGVAGMVKPDVVSSPDVAAARISEPVYVEPVLQSMGRQSASGIL